MQLVLDQHNIYRCMAGVDPLVWDDDIAANAQAWADVADYGHSEQSSRVVNGETCGENLAWGETSQTGPDAVKAWYSEILYTSPRGMETVFREATGHYTAVMWQSTVRLGCGRARATAMGGEGDYTVCQYGPTGGWAGQFEEQVLPPIYDVTQCGGCPNDDPTPFPPGPGVAVGTTCDDTTCDHSLLAKSCMACPQGNGAEWCTGDCVWNEDASQCIAAECAVGDTVLADYTDQPCVHTSESPASQDESTYRCRRYAATIEAISGDTITVAWSDGDTSNKAKTFSEVRKHGNTCDQVSGTAALPDSTPNVISSPAPTESASPTPSESASPAPSESASGEPSTTNFTQESGLLSHARRGSGGGSAAVPALLVIGAWARVGGGLP